MGSEYESSRTPRAPWTRRRLSTRTQGRSQIDPQLTIGGVSHSLKDNVTEDVVYEFGPFLLEPHTRRLSRGGEIIALAAPEFELLLLLVRNHGRVVEKSEIMETVWPDVEVEENNLTVRMSSLRRALGESKGYHPYIQTVTGRGYCMIAEVTEQSGTIDNQDATIEVASPDEPAILEQVVSSESTAIKRTSIFGTSRRKLYALLLVAVLAASAIAAVLLWRRSDDSSQSMKMSRATFTGRVAGAAISPDGQTIAYVERDGDLHSLWIQLTGSNTPRQLLAPAKLSYQHPAFSPDGNTLYYSKCDPHCKLHKLPVLGGVETALPVHADSLITFSPDGRQMAYMRVEPAGPGVVLNLLVANTDGTNEETIHTRKGDTMLYQGGAPSWSPDGKMIAFPIMADNSATPMQVIGINVADRKESTLTSKKWRYGRDVAWLPDGDGFIINARDEASSPELSLQIWRVSYPGGETRRITNDLNNYVSVSISPQSNTLIAVDMTWTSGLSLASAENPSAAVQITHGTIDRRDGYLGVAAGPEGRVIYVSDFNGNRDLWSVDADGTNQKQLTDGLHRDIYPAVTPDGRYVVFESTRDGTHSIWRMDADGRNHRRLTRGYYDAEAACSPDGKWIVYVAHEYGLTVPILRKAPIEGTSNDNLTAEYSVHPTISPDGKRIAYYRIDAEKQERGDIVIIPADGGLPLKTLRSPENFGDIMRWSHSGDSLMYRDRERTGVWKLPLDGSQPSPVFTLRNEQLFAFSSSPDGRRLVYASGRTVTDVILITRFNE